MKKAINYLQVRSTFILLLVLGLTFNLMESCNRDDSDDDNLPTTLGTPQSSEYYFLMYSQASGHDYKTVPASTDLGSPISSGSGWDKWYHMSGVFARGNQFLIMHSIEKVSDLISKDFQIRRIYPGGIIGEVTQSQVWNNTYETFFGYHVGDRGYIFGQDEHGKHWFIQEVLQNGTLAPNLSSQGNWNNYYEHATPIYIGDQTYIFFQDNNAYWFITHVDENGNMNDVCDGTWEHEWEVITSVTSGGNTFLVGHGNSVNTGDWFIQWIYADGTMGDETDRGTWNNHYEIINGLTIGGQGYLYGSQNFITGPWQYFFQKISADGKMGEEVGHGLFETRWDVVIPFMDFNDPGSFRYSIGWDLSTTSGLPASWSSRYDDPWNGNLKFGGGAALANIDGDAGNTLDAVLVGIQDEQGADRFYYKVAWNLDATGKASSMTGTMIGATIGEGQAGAGADITDLDNNGIPDLVLMVVDDPEAENSFRYYIGWNLNHQGVPQGWSDMIQGPSLGTFDSGGGAAIGDIDKNGRPDMLLMAIDNPQQDNAVWMVIAKDLDATGHPASWSDRIYPGVGVGWLSSGGGAALADINNNGQLDLVLTDVDSPAGPDAIWCWVGWNIDIHGNVTGWSGKFTAPSTGNMTYGAGTAVGDINKNGIPDILVMAVDNPYGVD